jgi:multicomponent Na+:H+ antiporter subunit A
MEAPTPASAFLHSSTMVKAGIYLVARLNPVLGDTELWEVLVTGAGLLTMVVAGYLAFRQTVLKPLLAYTTLVALGLIMAGIGLGDGVAVKAAMAFLLVHALYKAALFMVAGAIDHEAGEKNVERLGGLRRAMPVTAAAAGLAGLSMAGIPPFFGFIGKEALYEAALHGRWMLIVVAAAVFANAANVFVAMMVGLKPFWGRRVETPKHAHEGPVALWLGAAVLAVLGLVFGLVAKPVGTGIIAPATAGALGKTYDVKLALWHGVNTALILSIVTLVAGVALYLLRVRFRRATAALQPLADAAGPNALYFHALAGMQALARVQTRFFQSGYTRVYLYTIVAFVLAVPGYALVTRSEFGLPEQILDIKLHEGLVTAVIILAAWVTVFAKSRLAAIVSLGIVGYGVALIFVLFGAPDLAMTQFIIETLTVLLFVLVLHGLPRMREHASLPGRLRDLAIALLAGAFMSALVLAALHIEFAPPISPWFAEMSVPGGQGRNIVNVILVDFRALDTLGEITVLAVAALGAYALMRLQGGDDRKDTGSGS